MGRVTKAVAAGSSHRKRRGRPSIDWTERRKRKLLRLYLGTPASILSLKNIRSLLSEGDFQPAERKTQEVLRSMLSTGYNKIRPTTRAAMARRLEFFRSIRKHIRKDSPRQTTEATTVAPEGGNPGYLAPTHENDYLPAYHADGYGDSGVDISILNQHPPSPPSPPRRGISSPIADEATTAVTITHPKTTRIAFLRQKLSGSWTSSVLSGVASLIGSSLSIGSRKSFPIAPPPVILTDLSTDASPSESLLWESPMPPNPTIRSRLGETLGDDEVQVNLWGNSVSVAQDIPQKSMPPSSPHGSEWRGNPSTRLEDMMEDGNMSHEDAMSTDDESADDESADDEEKTPRILRVAASEASPLPLFTTLIRQGADPKAVNDNGETFMHLYKPWLDPSLTHERVDEFMTLLSRREFNFCCEDAEGRTFLQKWAFSGSMSLEDMDQFLSSLPEADLDRTLRGGWKGTTRGHGFWTWIQKTILAKGASCSLAYLRWKCFLLSQDAPVREHLRHVHFPGRHQFGNHGNYYVHQLVAGAVSILGLIYIPFQADVNALFIQFFDEELRRCTLNEVDQQDHSVYRQTPMMALLRNWERASTFKQFLRSVLSSLLRAGASVRTADEDGCTPLHLAVASQSVDAIELLCEAGADVNAVTVDGATPLDVARRHILLDSQFSYWASAHMASWFRCSMLLIGHGGAGGEEQDWMQWFDWAKYGIPSDLVESMKYGMPRAPSQSSGKEPEMVSS